MNIWWPRRGYSDTLRERRISVWGTRGILPFTDILMLATATIPTIIAPFRVTCRCLQEDQWLTWSSKKQLVVALSSCESEHIALAYASQEAVYLSDLLSELTFPQFSSVQMYENHQVLQNSRPGRTYLYEIPFSPRAGCIEYNNRISWQGNRSAGGHFDQILGPQKV